MLQTGRRIGLAAAFLLVCALPVRANGTSMLLTGDAGDYNAATRIVLRGGLK